jgi:hypothetical protein
MAEQNCDLQRAEQEVQAHKEQAQTGEKERHPLRLGGACYSGVTFRLGRSWPTISRRCNNCYLD